MNKYSIFFEFSTPVGVLNRHLRFNAVNEYWARINFIATHKDDYKDLNIISICKAV